MIIKNYFKLDSKIPIGPLNHKWINHKSSLKLVSPSNRSNIEIIVVGTGLSGGSISATLAELGYQVKVFCYQDSPRRAHSVAAQGGINAAKNYKGDNDSVYQLFYDTIKGGDYRSREANVYRLAEISSNIIDQCVAQGVPFARDYAGYLENRSFGGTKVSRTFYAKGQTGQQLLLACYSSMSRQIGKGRIKMYNRYEMLELVVIDGIARGIISRNLVSGEIERYAAHAVIIASGGYGNVFFLSTNAMGSNSSAIWKVHKKGGFFANPCFTQIHPTCIPAHANYQSKLTLMSESLRNDGRIWVPKNIEDAISIRNGEKNPEDILEEKRDYYLERRYPSFGNLVPRDVASRAAKECCDKGFGIENNENREGVFLDFSSSIERYGIEKANELGIKNPSLMEIKKFGEEIIESKYGNLFHMYEKITDQNPYKNPMKIYPAVHYTMGGLWVDYNLMSSIPGCYVIGEANFSDHGANRLGASALMQGLADGYFILPYTIADYISKYIHNKKELSTKHIEFDKSEKKVKQRILQLISNNGDLSVDYFHRKLGNIMWKYVGMSRDNNGLSKAIKKIQELRDEFWKNIFVPGNIEDGFNSELEKAGRVADFLELGELIAMDALYRKESCGSHFRIENQTKEGESLRDDFHYKHVSIWKYQENKSISEEIMYKENLTFSFVKLQSRSYK
ncbi:fumarate reductase/succinate dehydrogenase flavoprotein subunit [Blattabacterium punctulatus]|uniref:fumarate reductase/succinate dehydrogenase flavoprotein subunit n=1 Tax=Blattabacterium punctulatus TaxID=164514 RepID=UPI000D7CA641|nr:fumarate reductase/succinate dehydrogenase flavoprotein subunit [Blattabacterium punctulatus]AWU43064.1 fumarate reductase/succinate dehydrogenase flavoprotein subunit [Blattabacterium punctulatus]